MFVLAYVAYAIKTNSIVIILWLHIAIIVYRRDGYNLITHYIDDLRNSLFEISL